MSVAEAFTEDELSRLTPEERAAVTADDDMSDAEAIANGDDPGADEDESNETGSTEAKADPAEINLEPAPKTPFTAEPVEGYEEKVAAAEAKRDEAFKQMMDGELTAEEYRAIEKASSKEIRELDAKNNEHAIAESMTRQASQQAWVDYVGVTLNAAKTNGADLIGDQKIAAELDRTVKLLSQQVIQDPTMVADVPQARPGELITPTDKWILNEAMQIVAARHGMTLGKAKPGPTNKTRQPDLSEVPPTLARVPASADQNTGGDEFAYMRNLEGAEYEKAITRMAPDVQERWLNSAT